MYIYIYIYIKLSHCDSLVVQWLRLHAPTTGDTNSIPGQGTKILLAMQHGRKKKKLLLKI